MGSSRFWPPGEDVVFPPETQERKELDDSLAERALSALVQYYRHSAVGRRCSGIIHNLNTPLQVISFHLELLEQKAQEESALLREFASDRLSGLQQLLAYRLQKLSQMQEEVEKLQNLMQQLVLQSLHESEEDKRFLDLNQVFQEELALYVHEPFFKHQVQKEFHFDPRLPPIVGHYIDFSQSFRNLVDNALEAMAKSPRRVLTVKTFVEGTQRILMVGDTGCGLSPEVRAHLFEPFFTTKRNEGKGHAGLGLFMAKRLLSAYSAEITLEGQPGQTRVTVRLPID